METLVKILLDIIKAFQAAGYESAYRIEGDSFRNDVVTAEVTVFLNDIELNPGFEFTLSIESEYDYIGRVTGQKIVYDIPVIRFGEMSLQSVKHAQTMMDGYDYDGMMAVLKSVDGVLKSDWIV